MPSTSWRPEEDHGNGVWAVKAGNAGGWSAWASRYLWAYRPEQAFGYTKSTDPLCLGPWAVWNHISGESCPSDGIWRIYPSGPDSQVLSANSYFYWGKLLHDETGLWHENDPYVQVDIEAANHTDIPWSKIYWKWGSMDSFDEDHQVPIYVDSTSPDVQVHHATCWFRPETSKLRFDPICGMPSSNPFGDGAPHLDLAAIRFLRYVTWPKWEFDLLGNRKGWTTYGIEYEHYPESGRWALYYNVDHPKMRSPKLQIQGEDWGRVCLTAANHTSFDTAYLYYKSSEGGAWLPLTTIEMATDGAFHTYEVPISVSGPIAYIRIDPVGDGDSSVPGTYWRLSSFELLEPSSTRTLSLAANPTGAGGIALNDTSRELPWSGEIAADSDVTLTAQAGEGFAFANWSGDAGGAANPLVVTMDTDLSITAHFETVGSNRILSVPHVLAGVTSPAIDVPVELDDPTGVAGIDFTITFDAAIVQCVDVQTTDCTSGWLLSDSIDNGIGTCSASMISLDPITDCVGPVATVVFSPASGVSAGDATALEISGVSLFDGDAQPIPVLPQSGSITFTGGSDPYDVDRSGTVNSADALLLLRAAVGLPAPDGWSYDWPPLECNDVNQDGVINSADAILVLRHAVGLDASRIAAAGLRATSDVSPRVVSIPTSTTGLSGDEIQLPVTIDDADGLAGIDLRLLFDPSVVEVVSVSATDTTDDLLLSSNMDNSAGSVSVSLAGTDALPAGAATLLNVVFRIVGDPMDSCFLHFDLHSLYDSDAALVQSSASDGTVRVDFHDVLSDQWAHDQVNACVDAGIVQGYEDGTYGPAQAVTRDQMAAYIARARAGGDEYVPEFTDTPTFPDVPEGFWALDYVEYAVQQNVVTGYDDGLYHPTDPVTRDQMAVYIARAMVAPSGEVALDDYVPADPRNFPDVPATGCGDTGTDPFWAYTHIEYCVENEVVFGYDDGYYRPTEVVTRDQMAVYISRAFELTL